MALECFWWGPFLDLLQDSRNGALWLEHCTLKEIKVGSHEFSPNPKIVTNGFL